MSIVPYPRVADKWEAYKTMAVTQSNRLIMAAETAPDALAANKLRARGGRMATCASLLEYDFCRDCGNLHIRRTNLCRDRLCPLCNWRLSLQRIGETINAMQHIAAGGYAGHAAMLTLTQRNCAWEDLASEMQRITAAWHMLTKRRDFARHVVGWARSIEITQGVNCTLHPHLHILLLFRPGYAGDITQREWAQMWRDALDLDYVPIVDIRRAYCKTDAEYQRQWEALTAATVEATKYAFKAETILAIEPDQLAQLAQAIQGIRMVGYGGIVRRARLDLKYKDSETVADTVCIAAECPKCGAQELVTLGYHWSNTTYLLNDFTQLAQFQAAVRPL